MASIQYTIRGVPQHVDRALRQRAAEAGVSLNAVALEALARGLGLGEGPVVQHDLDFVIGTWEEDPEFDRVMEEFERIDEELWR